MAVGSNTLKAGLAKKATPPPNLENSKLGEMFGLNKTVKQAGEISLALLDAHPQQHHYSMDSEELEWLAANIAEVGVLDPIHVQPKPDGRFTILAGHRRTEASKRAGKTTIPAFIDTVDDATASIIFNATNVGQRHKLSYSEIVFAYTEIERSLQERGTMNGKTTAAIAEQTGHNVRQIQRYKRLASLLPEFMAMLDNENLPLRAAVDLSYLTFLSQQHLLDAMRKANVTKLDMAIAEQLKAAQQAIGDNTLPENILLSILAKEDIAPVKPKKTAAPKSTKTVIGFTIPRKKIEGYFPEGAKKADIEKIILTALADYFSKQE